MVSQTRASIAINRLPMSHKKVHYIFKLSAPVMEYLVWYVHKLFHTGSSETHRCVMLYPKH